MKLPIGSVTMLLLGMVVGGEALAADHDHTGRVARSTRCADQPGADPEKEQLKALEKEWSSQSERRGKHRD
jgi:hypothetical protein